jgi:large subunit ribosomal protein L25
MRRAGRIPAIIYGHAGTKPVVLDGVSFERTFREITESTIVTLKVDGSEHDVLVKDYQEDLLKGQILHVDFYEIERGKVLRVNVPIHLTGNAQGVKEGGVLENPIHELEVECLPKDIPEYIELDVTGLNIGDVLHVSDVELAGDVRIMNMPEQTVVAVTLQREELPEEEEEEEGLEEGLEGEEGEGEEGAEGEEGEEESEE